MLTFCQKCHSKNYRMLTFVYDENNDNMTTTIANTSTDDSDMHITIPVAQLS